MPARSVSAAGGMFGNEPELTEQLDKAGIVTSRASRYLGVQGDTPMPQQKQRPPNDFEPEAQQDFIDETLAFWQPRTSRRLTREDAREIAYNVTGFFRLLHAWAQADAARSAATSPADDSASTEADERRA